ncbi:MAG TPA: hypothetical protein DDW70_00905 [Rikenellaceae bacterium]|jgi:hypothetical protein|nr:BACON domain-containing protein [Bacteroidales bacterium]OQB69468.1 MAG: hypothetical protein BWX93_01228 [Bacteroidetes bacterium ADurb.Bin139]HBG52763.1 hypothetical protein [Rikenellaceae bacterium]HQN82341.1 BACON domain-containing protein [Bacteroidales bacterium]
MKKVSLLLCLLFFAGSCEKEPYLSINPGNLNCDPNKGSSYVALSCNTTWTIAGIPDWITMKPDYGEGDATIIVEYEANKEETDRLATLTFIAGIATANLTISQKGVEPTTYSISNQTGETMYSVVVFEFDESGNIIKDVSLGTMNNLKTTSKIKAAKNSNRIKVGVKISENLNYVYTASYTYLEKEKHTSLTITGNTIISGSLL